MVIESGKAHGMRCSVFSMRMKQLKKQISGVLLGVVLTALAPYTVADFKSGLDAANRGDFNAAQKEWKALAQKGDAESQYNLGALLLSGKLGQQDPKKAVAWIEKAANQGHVEAANALGMLYHTGSKEFAQDFKKAYKYFLVAAKKGNPPAQFGLGVMLLNGQGVKKDVAAGADWVRKAAEQGHVMAQYSLGVFYASGQSGKKQPEDAYKWFFKAADQGLPGAQYNVARMNMDGQGVAMDIAAAKSWLTRAADKGHIEAQYALGVMAYIGVGEPKNPADALKWLQRAAKGWDRGAQFLLGRLYMDGDGVKADPLEAYKWFDLAASSGHDDAHFYRAAVAAKLSATDREKAHKAAQEWFDSNHSNPHKHYDLKPHHH